MSRTTSDSPAWLPKHVLELVDHRGGQLRGVEQDAQRQRADAALARPSRGRPRPPRASGGRARPSARPGTSCRRPCGRRGRARRTTSSTPSAPSYSASALPKTRISMLPSRSSSVANIIGSPFLVRIFLAWVMMPPAVTQSPSLRAGSSATGASTVCAQRLAHLLERVGRDEEADRLLLDGQQLGLVELVGAGSAGATARRRPPRRSRCRAARTAAVTAEVEDRALADLGVELLLLAGGLGLLEHLRACPCGRARRAERPALDERLDRLLVDGARIDAGAEVPQRAERAAAPRGRP